VNSAARARVFGTLLAVLTVAGAWLLASTAMPPLAAAGRVSIDHAVTVNLWITGAVFVLSHLILIATLLRARARSEIAENPRVEFAWTSLTAAVLVLLLVVAERDTRALGRAAVSASSSGPSAKNPRSDESLNAEVVGQQFAWNFRFPGPDGLFGRTDASLVDQAALNFIGLDRSDPAAEDDVVLPQGLLIVPEGREIRLRIRSMDVIHSFFAPAFRVKRDAVPGMESVLVFTPTSAGEYEIACAEHCGLGHYRMRAVLAVVPRDEFASRLREATQ
jgi:cytochrome c oxidase subunit 2